MPRLAILRLRQPQFVAEGLPDRRLRQIVAGALGESLDSFSGEISNDTHHLPVDLQLLDADDSRALADVLVDRSRDSAVVLVDMQLDDSLSPSPGLQWLLFRAFDEIGDKWPENTQLVIMFPLLPTKSDPIRKARHPLVLRGNLTIVDANGGHIRSYSSEQPAERLLRTAVRTPADARAAIEGRVLRRRGVFSVGSMPGQYSLFRYSIDAAREELSDWLRDYIDKTNASVVLFDGFGGPWLGEAIARANSKLGRLPYYLISDLESPAPDAASTDVLMAMAMRRDLEDADGRICVVLPMVNTRSRATRVAELLEEQGYSASHYLAVFVPLDHSRRVNDEDRFAGDALFEVPMKRVDETSWEVEAAISRGELNLEELPNGAPTTVAMLTMLAQYGTGPEKNGPRGRRPLSRFPRLRNLDTWDAYWLADSLVEQVKKRTGAGEGQLLFVLPERPGLATHLTEALESRLNIAVTALAPKAMRWIRNLKPESRDLLLAFKDGDKRIVVADGAAVSYSTLKRLRRVVDRVTQRQPNLYAVVFDSGADARVNEDRPEPLISFYRLTSKGQTSS
ncbi:hypothetical protein BH11ACT5_BH11ACT5_07790 [soil metagenome]